MNPTLIGLFSVIVWGFSVPISRLIVERIGAVGYAGFLFFGVGLIGCGAHWLQKQPWPSKTVFRNPYFYVRWLGFVLHEGLLPLAIYLVQKQNVPLVILLNYLWPTAVIVSSVLISGVKITRMRSFVLGALIVVLALFIEILGPHGLSSGLFIQKYDCLSYALVFIGAVSWGIYSAASRRTGDLSGGSTVTPLFQLTLALALPLSFMPRFDQWDHLTSLMFVLLAAYCFLQFLAWRTWDHGVRHGNIVILSLCADFIPWLSLLGAHLLLGVDIGPKTILSAVLLVTGAIITRYGTQQKNPVEVRVD